MGSPPLIQSGLSFSPSFPTISGVPAWSSSSPLVHCLVLEGNFDFLDSGFAGQTVPAPGSRPSPPEVTLWATNNNRDRHHQTRLSESNGAMEGAAKWLPKWFDPERSGCWLTDPGAHAARMDSQLSKVLTDLHQWEGSRSTRRRLARIRKHCCSHQGPRAP